MKLFLTTLLALYSLGTPVSAWPWRYPASQLEKRAAPFESVPTKIKHDHSGKNDPADKYFHESTFHPHYDGRFADHEVNYDEKLTHLTALMQSYLSKMNEIGAETWIMHGSLLGWFWNRKILPWDSDIDVQMSEKSMEHISDFYNMTVHHFKLPSMPEGRDYMLEVNPHWRNGSDMDVSNWIDARWLDTDTGLFIDITTLRPNLTAQEEGHEGYMMCKDRHHYNFTDIFPLRESIFEGIPVKIPYAYTDLLIEEYTHEALAVRDYEDHHFDQVTMEWKPISTTQGGKHKDKFASKPGSYGFRGSIAAGRAALARIFPGSPKEDEDLAKPPTQDTT